MHLNYLLQIIFNSRNLPRKACSRSSLVRKDMEGLVRGLVQPASLVLSSIIGFACLDSALVFKAASQVEAWCPSGLRLSPDIFPGAASPLKVIGWCEGRPRPPHSLRILKGPEDHSHTVDRTQGRMPTLCMPWRLLLLSFGSHHGTLSFKSVFFMTLSNIFKTTIVRIICWKKIWCFTFSCHYIRTLSWQT